MAISVSLLFFTAVIAGASQFAPAAHAQLDNSVTVTPGEVTTLTWGCFADSTNTDTITASEYASGDAASWASPNSYDCGSLAPGQGNYWTYTLSVPAGTPPGVYQITWDGSCQYAGGGSCTWTPATVTITVEAQTTTTESSTTSNTTQPLTTSSVPNATQQCGPGEHLGGIPNSQNSFICVPDGLQVDTGTSPSVTPVGDGVLVDTMTGSVVDITCPTGASCTSAPDSAALGATTWAGVYSTTCGTASECATAYATYLQKFYGACQANSGCSQAWELATSFNDYQEKITTFLTTATDQGFTTASANLFVNLVDGWAWQKCSHALTDAYKFVTSNGAIVPVGDGDPELSILAAKNGTTIYDWKGDAFVQSFATGQTLLMSAGEKLFIPSDQAQASQQNLITSAQAFSPASTTQWWNTNGGPNYATLLSLVVIAGIILVAAGYAVKRRRGRAGQGARAVFEYPSPGPAQGSAPTTSQLACPSCGASAAPGAAFCGNCGSSLSQGVVCPHCGASNPSGAKFCQACSKRI